MRQTGFALIVLILVLIALVLCRPAHAATYPACPLAGGVCAPQSPTLNQCDMLVKGITPTPAQLHDAADWVPIDRAQALASKDVCYGKYHPLFLTEADVEPGRQTIWKMDNGVSFQDGASEFTLAAHTYVSNKKAWAFIKTKDANGNWIVDANLPPALYAVTADIIGAHWADLMPAPKGGSLFARPKSYLKYLTTTLRWSPNFAFGVSPIGSGINTTQVPPFEAGLLYNINGDFGFGYDFYIRNCAFVPACKRKLKGAWTVQFDATRAAAAYILGADVAIQAGEQAIIGIFKPGVAPFSPYGP